MKRKRKINKNNKNKRNNNNNNNSNTFMLLTVIYITCILVANILAAKIINIFGISLASGILVFPITYIIGDVLTEVYGYKKAKQVILYGFLCNLIMVVTFYIAMKLPYPAYWANQEAFEIILGNTPRILLASFIGYLVGGFSNSFIMDYIKNNSKIKYLWFRTILSTLVGEALDTTIFVLIGFLGTMNNSAVFMMLLYQLITKVLYEVLFTPVLYIIINKIKKIENIS